MAKITEPFLINPPKRYRKNKVRKHRLTLIGKRISGKSKIAKKMRGFKINRKRAHKRVRRMKKNPLSLMLLNKIRGGETKMARRKHKRSHKKSYRKNPVMKMHRRRKSSRRSFMHNPVRALSGIVPPVMPLLKEVAGVTAGFVAVKLIPQYIFPDSWKTGTMGYVSKGITIIGLSAISGMVLKNKQVQNALLVGGLLSIAVDLIGQVLPQAVSGGVGVYSLAPSPSTSLLTAGPGLEGYKLPQTPTMSNIDLSEDETRY